MLKSLGIVVASQGLPSVILALCVCVCVFIFVSLSLFHSSFPSFAPMRPFFCLGGPQQLWGSVVFLLAILEES